MAEVDHIGFFGGAFDPPHYGHLLTVTYAMEAGQFDSIFVVPAYKHPTKQIATPYEHRLEMTKLTFDTLRVTGRVRVSNIEQNYAGWSLVDARTGKVYTVDVLTALKAGKNHDEWRLIVGEDEEVEKWHRAEELIRIAPPFVVSRTFAPDTQLRRHVVDTSSTVIREAFAYGSGLARELVTPPVYDYIQKNKLYGQ